MKIFGYVYLVLNKLDGKVYIGQTQRSVSFRWGEHLRQLKGKKKSLLHYAIKKYGSENFVIVELHRAFSREELDEMETRAIFSHGSRDPRIGYNIAEGGNLVRNFGANNGMFGKKISPEERARRGSVIKAIRKENPIVVSPERRKKISISLLGNKRSSKPKTEDHKKNISDSMKKSWIARKAA